MLPSTQYFEVESEAVGTRFAVWVTPPPRYDVETDRSYPVVYQPDGNKTAPTTINSLLRDDPINPIEPIIQVQVGYVGADSRRMLAVRARDLLPPGEPLEPSTDETLMAKLVTAGLLSEPDAALLVATSEIHPNESHATGSAISYFSYLRACWPAPDRPTWLD